MPDVAAPADDEHPGVGGGEGGGGGGGGGAGVEHLPRLLLSRGNAAAPLHSAHRVDPKQFIMYSQTSSS